MARRGIPRRAFLRPPSLPLTYPIGGVSRGYGVASVDDRGAATTPYQRYRLSNTADARSRLRVGTRQGGDHKVERGCST